MSDDTNEQPTAKLEDLGFDRDAETDAGQTLPLPATAPTQQVPEGATTGPLPPPTEAARPTGPAAEAEPAWLRHWGETPHRTTPRVRWGGIIWGLVFIAAGWFTLWTLADVSRRAAFSSWMTTLTGGGWAVVAALALGGLLLLLGLIAGLRAATRPRA